MASTPDSILILAGATGSGKSDLALAVAERMACEIVSCDSVQIYRGFDIGSAKPCPETRARVPHHLIDVVQWHESFDAQRYVELADLAVERIRAAHHRPLVCGGTGLYLRAFRYGLVRLPKAPEGYREALFAEEAELPGSLYQRLMESDPASARTIEPNNTVYIVRALEIMEATGLPASEIRKKHGFKQLRRPSRIVALRWPPDVLRARIESRVHRMLADGLVEEVAGLLDAGVAVDSRPMRAVGYRETAAVIRGESDAEGLAERVIRSTWAYARRQRTWLRKERDVEWLDVEVPADLHAAAGQVSQMIDCGEST